MNIILNTQHVTQRFGGVQALTDVSIEVPEGHIFSIIGPNGAGKTTLFNAISGLAKPTEGKIFFRGEDLTAMKPFEIHEKGISRTFQNIRLFPEMTVLENVMIGNVKPEDCGIARAVLRTKEYRRQEEETRALAEQWLKFFDLYRLRYQNPGALPYGMQRKLEIARAMISTPRLLLLDEPAAGMNEAETAELRNDIRKLKEGGVTILLIEHDMRFVMTLSDTISVLHHGKLLMTGTPEEVSSDQSVIDAYLGTEVEA
ncbi:MAG: ABC transporter ATP-binding protein [Ndongobacter sp.]|nr:ABC transporter ATP-binding protein [Ndongobacter sp.]